MLPAFIMDGHDDGIREHLRCLNCFFRRERKVGRTHLRNHGGSEEKNGDVDLKTLTNFSNAFIPHGITRQIDSWEPSLLYDKSNDRAAVSLRRPVAGRCGCERYQVFTFADRCRLPRLKSFCRVTKTFCTKLRSQNSRSLFQKLTA